MFDCWAKCDKPPGLQLSSRVVKKRGTRAAAAAPSIAPDLLCLTDKMRVHGEFHSGWLLGPSLVSYHCNLCDNDRCQLLCATATFNSVTAGFALAYEPSHLAESPNWLWIQTGNLPFYRPRFWGGKNEGAHAERTTVGAGI